MQPAPQLDDAGRKHSLNVMHPPIPRAAQNDNSMSAAPNNFTFTTQTPTRATSAQSYVPSSLRSYKSSPIPASNTEEHGQTRNMPHYHSFAEFGLDGAGDTQPIDTQTFQEASDIGSSRVGLNAFMTATADEHFAIEDSEVVKERTNFDPTAEEDEGGADGLEDFEDVSSPQPLAATHVHNAFKFPSLPPRTPLTPGMKRKRSDEITTPNVRTSSTKGNRTVLRNLLGGQMSVPNLGNMSQLFMNTQAGSSPAPGGPHSDSPFNKPSPRCFEDVIGTCTPSMGTRSTSPS